MIRLCIAWCSWRSLRGRHSRTRLCPRVLTPLEQVATLRTALPVYKLVGADSRRYIDDADRPAEIAPA